ncbi:MAG: polysaccharide biosynthesis/export family protein [Bacteroidia bacterium]|nr:polysaccharide biosynthesis/export family protein [Bacteroidia bacterium]
MRYLLILLASLFLLGSCKIYRPNLMLKTKKDFSYDQLVDSLSRKDYKIAVNDVIEYRLFTNNGFDLINLAAKGNALYRNDIDVIVESDGMVKMPLIGRVPIVGLTIIQAEKLLEERYTKMYVEPFISLRITNRRVIVFPGNGGQAKVLPLANNNTTLLEAIASAGGIMEEGKAYKVKLIRNNPDSIQKPLVYLIDVSRIEGVTPGRSIVQAGDIIYVEPRYKPVATLVKEITPALTLLSTMLILYNVTK